MSQRFLTAALFALLAAGSLPAQQLVSVTPLGTKSQSELLAQFNIIFIQFGARYYRITYTTTGLQGQPDTVSGLLAVPDNPNKVYPRIVYQHGTSGSKLDVPSFNYGQGLEGSVGLLLAGMGYVALLPDYLGLGVSDGFHPYVHAASEAQVAIDMLHAAAAFTAQNDVHTNSQLFITGYSQGGHAAMALHREIDRNWSDEFTVTASAPLSGPYSISGVMRNLILTDKIYYYPAYLPNTILSYQTVYGNIFDQISDVFKPKYASTIQLYYENKISLTDLNINLFSLLTLNEGECRPFRMLQDSVVQAVLNDPAHPMNLALKDNDVYNDWTPQAPMRLFYCTADDQVPFGNSVLASDTLLAAGAVNFLAQDVNPTADHGACYSPAMTNAVLFFFGFQQIGTLSAATAPEKERLELYPNPAASTVTLKNLPARGHLTVVDYSGHRLKSVALESGSQTLPVNDLPDGVYMVLFEYQGKVQREKLIVRH